MNDALTITSVTANDDGGFGVAISPIIVWNVDVAAGAPPPGLTAELQRAGKILLDSTQLRHLRQSRLLSQQDLADDCWRRNIRVSIATIKRAESGRAVRFRVARELARCFDVPVMQLARRLDVPMTQIEQV